MQRKLFYNFTKETFAPAWADYINNQKQQQMKKKKPAIKAKKRIRLNVECHSQAEKVYFVGVIEKAKKKLQKLTLVH